MSKPKTQEQAALKELWPGQSVELLKALHILTRDGGLNADSRRKLKQVLHLVQLLRPPLERLFDEQEAPRLADLGAGKSYLGFILYDLIFGPKGRGEVVAVEARGPLMEVREEPWRRRAGSSACASSRAQSARRPSTASSTW